MGLNDIQLSANVLAGLYPSSLVLTDEVQNSPRNASVVTTVKPVVAESKPATREVKYLGSNQQHILILVNYPDSVHLPDDALNFLTNILTACKLGLGDVAIMNQYPYRDTGYKELLTFFKSRTILMFDVAPSAIDLPVTFPEFQVQLLAGTTFLHGPSLEVCRDDKLMKSKLWVSLQRIFSIK